METLDIIAVAGPYTVTRSGPREGAVVARQTGELVTFWAAAQWHVVYSNPSKVPPYLDDTILESLDYIPSDGIISL